MRTIVDLPDNQIDALSVLGKKAKLSRAELLRRAVAEYLRRHQPEQNDASFGLWKERGEDALALQNQLRSEWNK